MNRVLKFVCCAVSVAAFSSASAQSIQKTFEGNWGRTSWTFEFYSDNTYSRSSSGHSGETEQQGVYEMHGDTIKLITGSKQIDGMENSSYLLQDSLLIDLQISTDNAVVKPGINFFGAKESAGVILPASRDLILVFDYDETQIHIKWNDFIKILSEENENFSDANKYHFTNDTLKLNRYWLAKDQSDYAVFTGFNEELFELIDAKKAIIYRDGEIVKEFYTKRKISRYSNGRTIYYKGIQYFDKKTKKHLLNKTIYKRLRCGGCPSF